ncbi:uncharacterized protein LOC128877054 isoform X1 [Hylaeus volcanicus]|uniref:uncharacterized protein LOC128877054 isoform X1 n=1 Tax=Hylaeus volcanicus TaxID=313075 RepID=UPI0023B790E6|nr:uncharacterized protein LOC128877054 isoform X1 [Hylaeus volcanicus]
MQFHVAGSVIFLVVWFTLQGNSQSDEPLPAILGGIGNVASSATNFLTGMMQRQKELLHRVTDTASDLITSAVEKPRNLLINATRVTTGIIDSAASKGLEFKLRRFLEKFRNRMPYGIPELGLPPLEPFQLDEVDVNIDNPEIGNLSLTIENLVIHNLSTFVINKAKLSLIGPTIIANISIPHIYAEGMYNVSGNIGDMLQLNGTGPFQTDIYDFQIYVNTVLGYSRGMYLKSFYLDFTLRSIEMRLEDFMEDEELSRIMSKVFQELTPKALDIIKPDILPGIQSYVAGRVNETIHHLTMRDIFSILVGQSEIRDFAHLLVP